jgi:hypothetical protein
VYAEQLERIQRILGDAFRQFEPIDELGDTKSAVESIVSGNHRLSPVEQAEIYRGQFWLRHRDALYEDYPGLAYILGEDGFEQFLRDYLLACPPDSWTLRDLGNRIATFAASYEGFPDDKAGLARDMAAFELAFIDVWDGEEAEPITLERVESIPPEAWITAEIAFHPLLSLLTLDHPVHVLRKKIRADEEPSLEVASEPTFVALWRGHNGRVHYRGISAGEDALIRSLRAGDDLGTACERAVERIEDAAALAGELQSWFRGWAKRGWIVDVTTP